MAAKFQVGASMSNITPKLGTHIAGYFNDRIAEDINDELHSKAIVLDNGDTSLAFVVCDLIALLKDDVDVIKQRGSQLTGIPYENIFVAATHTHTGASPEGLLGTPRDDAYMDWAMEKAGDAIKLAQNRLQPALFGHYSGSCPEEVHNRRWHMKDGSVKMNPGFQNPDMVRPAGPIDPEVAWAVFLTEDYKPIAGFANYALHYVGGGLGTAVSADYFAQFGRAMQRMAGSDFVAIMANGCCGDINNCDFTRPVPQMLDGDPYYQVTRVANAVATEAYGAWQQIWEYTSDVDLAAYTKMIDFTRREYSADEIKAAKAYIASSRSDDLTELVYAHETILVSEEPVTIQTPIMGLRIGDLGIVGLPGEIFVEYGLQIKDSSPFTRTMTIELANDYVGYCATEIALEQGSYETRLCRSAKAAAGTEALMVNAAVEVLNKLAE